jgi:hypothetical protein
VTDASSQNNRTDTDVLHTIGRWQMNAPRLTVHTSNIIPSCSAPCSVTLVLNICMLMDLHSVEGILWDAVPLTTTVKLAARTEHAEINSDRRTQMVAPILLGSQVHYSSRNSYLWRLSSCIITAREQGWRRSRKGSRMFYWLPEKTYRWSFFILVAGYHAGKIEETSVSVQLTWVIVPETNTCHWRDAWCGTGCLYWISGWAIHLVHCICFLNNQR